jgi:RNA polymerase sigma-70 factor (ECF subfamily)
MNEIRRDGGANSGGGQLPTAEHATRTLLDLHAAGAGRDEPVADAGKDAPTPRTAGHVDTRTHEVPSVAEESDWIGEAQRGSHVAFERLYHLHAGRMYGLCMRLTADPTDAETLMQDTFVRAWEKLGSYRGEGAFGGWLRRLAVHAFIDERRARGRRAEWLASDDATEIEVPVAPAPIADAIALERAVAALPAGARFAFVLHDIEGYRHREIAALAGTATGTVKAQLHRARRLLRDALGGTREVG